MTSLLQGKIREDTQETETYKGPTPEEESLKGKVSRGVM